MRTLLLCWAVGLTGGCLGIAPAAVSELGVLGDFLVESEANPVAAAVLSELTDFLAGPTDPQQIIPLPIIPARVLTSNLTQVKADRAYAKGLTGQRSAIFVVDSGLTAEPHPALPRSRVFSATAVAGDRQYRSAAEAINQWHGTLVTGVIAARPIAAGVNADGQQIQGVAPGATILSIQFFTNPPPEPTRRYVPISVSGFGSSMRGSADSYRFLNTVPGAFVNASFGFNGGIELQQYTEAALRQAMGQETIDIFAQAGVDDADKLVHVWAAGNARGRNGTVSQDYSSPEILPGLPVRLTELQGNWLVVVAVNPPEAVALNGNLDDLAIPRSLPGGLAFFSNACGLAADFCLAAPGVCVPTTAAPSSSAQGYSPADSGLCSGYGPSPEGYARQHGTSFSAPMVTGALALVDQLFRGQLNGAQLAARLLQTADDTDYDLQDDGTSNHSRPDYSNEAIYGHGLLDLDAATEPLGTLSLPLSDGRRQALSDTAAHSVVANSAAHNLHTALLAGLGQTEIMALDGLDSPFWLRADTLLQSMPIQPAIAVPTGLAPPPIQLTGGDRWGMFATAGSPPGLLLAAEPHATPFSPLSQLLNHDTFASGVRLQVGSGTLSALWGRGHATARNATGRNDYHPRRANQIWAAQYRLPLPLGSLALVSGAIEESGGLLGLAADSLRAHGLSTQTQFAGLELAHRLGRNWRLRSAWQRTDSRVHLPSGGLLTGVSDLQGTYAALTLSHAPSARASSAYTASAHTAATAARLSLSLEYHRAFAGGQSHWRLPQSLSDGEVVHGHYRIDLRRPAQHIVKLGYLHPIGRNSSVELRLHRSKGTGLSTQNASHFNDDSVSLYWRLRL